MNICEFRSHNFADLKYAKPCDIPNLALWLDANDTATLLDPDGNVCSENLDNVKTWLDKSDNELNATAQTSSNLVLPQLRTNIFNNKNVIQFDQFNIQKIFVGEYPFETFSATSFCVFKMIGPNQAGGRIFAFSSNKSSPDIHHVLSVGSSPFVLTAYSSTFEGPNSYLSKLHSDYDFSSNFSQPTSSAIGWTVTSVTWQDPLTNNFLINGAEAAQISTSTPIVFGRRSFYSVASELFTSGSISVAGGTGYFSGFIGEIIVYNRVLKSFEVDLINKYLLFKWKNATIE